MLRQEGRCADCRTRLIIGFFVFDHRPPLAMRDEGDEANDPDRLAAICWTCDEQKTPKDLRGCLETFGEGGWPGRGVIPDGCRSQSGQPHVDPGHPSAA